jgi:hypothetical protein
VPLSIVLPAGGGVWARATPGTARAASATSVAAIPDALPPRKTAPILSGRGGPVKGDWTTVG